MRKDDLRDKIVEYGDAVITYRSQDSKKLKYNVCTLNFDNKHIQTKQNRAQEAEDTLLAYCWDIDSYRLLKPANVTSVEPLSKVVAEKGRGR